jgi:hypothetical protein
MKICALVALLLTLVIAGCGGSNTIRAAKNPQTKQDIAKAQSIVQGCVSKGNFVTAGGRKAVINCIAPSGHKAAFEACASKAVAHPFFTSKERERIMQGLAVCAEENR